MLLLFTSAPMSFFKSSDDVSIAILFILSGADFLSFIISSSTFFISSLICSSRASLLILIFLIALSLESLKIFFASILPFEIISSYSLSLDSLLSLCFSAASTFSCI
jgi:hypothetical protein